MANTNNVPNTSDAWAAALRDAAHRYRAANISFLPIGTDGTKSPAFWLLPEKENMAGMQPGRTWLPFQQRLPTDTEIDQWLPGRNLGGLVGIAAIGGAVSRGLECIDIDSASDYEPWATRVNAACPGLLDRLVHVQTPRPGRHVWFRSSGCEKSQKLARRMELDAESGEVRPKVFIESKGEKGYGLVPPSPPECHRTFRLYTYLGDRTLDQVPAISIEERAVLISCARRLDALPPPPVRTMSVNGTAQVSTNPTADAFNRDARWEHILIPAGWSLIRESADGVASWSRPGKVSGGTSATTNYGGLDLLSVFSSNAAPFEEGSSYSKFKAFALLWCAGDFGWATQSLKAFGFGCPFTRRRWPVRLPAPRR